MWLVVLVFVVFVVVVDGGAVAVVDFVVVGSLAAPVLNFDHNIVTDACVGEFIYVYPCQRSMMTCIIKMTRATHAETYSSVSRAVRS